MEFVSKPDLTLPKVESPQPSSVGASADGSHAAAPRTHTQDRVPDPAAHPFKPKLVRSDRASALLDSSSRAMLEGLARVHPLVMALDPDRRIAWMSDGLGVACGGPERMLGRSVHEFLAEVRGDDRAMFRDQIDAITHEMRDKGHIADTPIEFSTRDGAYPVQVSAFRVDDETGEEEMLVCIAHPIEGTGALTREQAHVEPESKLAFILESTPDGVMTVDRLGFVISANAAAGRILGIAPAELTGQTLSKLMTDTGRAEEIAAALIAHGEVASEEIEVVRSDGERAWLSVSARTTELDYPATAETVVIIRDVTERHETREALESKNDELETYVRSVSHDLRSPLVALLGFARLLREDYRSALDATGLHFIDRIEEAGRNMERLLADMLELTRIGATPHYRTQVNPRPVLLQIVAELKESLEEKGIEVEIPVDPPAVLCDRTRLYQLFSNLIGNSIHHMGQADQPRIVVRVDAKPDGFLIEVSDNGQGIPKGDIERIFEIFQTGSRPNGRKRSSGLGLSIVKKIVESHSGRIWVESAENEGARFFVHLPAD